MIVSLAGLSNPTFEITLNWHRLKLVDSWETRQYSSRDLASSTYHSLGSQQVAASLLTNNPSDSVTQTMPEC